MCDACNERKAVADATDYSQPYPDRWRTVASFCAMCLSDALAVGGWRITRGGR